MRRRFVRRFAVLILVLCLVAPASAKPRQDDSQGNFISRIVKIIKHIIQPLEEIKPQLPTP
jgi:hypothetical protein